jgi:biotin operon repressor
MRGIDWVQVKRKLSGELSKEEERLLELLQQGLSTPRIAAALGVHRSNVWRQVQKLQQRGAEP